MATVDDLVVKIKADTSQISRGVDNTNRKLATINSQGSKSFKNLEKSIGSAITKVAALGTAVAGLGTQQIARVGMQFEDLSDSLNQVFGGIEGGQQAFRGCSSDGVLSSFEGFYR